MNSAEYTTSERAQLATWLEDPSRAANTMSIAELEGFLFALVCAPEPIPEQEWLAEVLKQGVENLEENELFALMALHNDVSNRVFETGYKVTDVIPIADDPAANFSADSMLHLWSLGFAKGLAFFIEPVLSAPNLADELREALVMTLGHLCFFSDLENPAEHAETVLPTLNDFTLGFAALIETVVLDAGLAGEDDW